MFKSKLVSSFIACSLLLGLNLQCKKNIDENPIDKNITAPQSLSITVKDFEQIQYTEYALSDLAEAKAKNWLKFQNLGTHIEQLKKGDFYFFKEDKAILKGFMTDLIKETPTTLYSSAIIVRLSVVETTAYKLEEVSNIKTISKQVLLKSIADILIAYNNLVFQINKKVEKDSRSIEKPL